MLRLTKLVPMLCCSLVLLTTPAYADTERLAGLFIRFSQYSEHPKEHQPIQLCVIQDQAMVTSLNRNLPQFAQFAAKAKLISTPEELKQCHLVWSTFPYWPANEWLSALTVDSVLWISDHPDLFRRGVLISVHYTPNSLRFRVNRTVAEQKKIRFNSRLLQLAHEII